MKVLRVSVTDGGKDYASAPSVTLSGGGGTGCRASAKVSAGKVTSVSVDEAGANYTSPPSVAFGTPGTGAAATAVVGD